MAELENKTEPENDVDNELGGLDEDTEETLVLISCEEQNPLRFEISRNAAEMCNLVKSILEGDPNAREMEIKKVTGEHLKLIVDYLKHHNGKVPAEIAKPIRSVKMEKIVEDPWDAEFINNLSKRTIFQVILGANYMDIKSLLHLGCAKIATLIKGKSPDDIRRILSDNEDQPTENDEQKQE
jgi:S-phase kinase-associated protein 1